LYVRSFINPKGKGTTIANNSKEKNIPTFISKTNQVLLSISSKDFSFIIEDNLSKIFSVFANNKLHMNLMQNSAISFSVCADNNEEKIAALKKELSKDYVVKANTGVEMLTVMHYTDASLTKLLKGKNILLEQRTRATVQFVLK
jgi:aspartate kinase